MTQSRGNGEGVSLLHLLQQCMLLRPLRLTLHRITLTAPAHLLPNLPSALYQVRKMSSSAPVEAPAAPAPVNLQKDEVTGEMVSKRWVLGVSSGRGAGSRGGFSVN